mgnify:FL=1
MAEVNFLRPLLEQKMFIPREQREKIVIDGGRRNFGHF